jgi:phosphatidate cytidylyltransferase
LKEFFTRTLTGAALAVVILGAIIWSPWAFFTLMAVVALIGLFEFNKLFQPSGYGSGSLIYYLVGISVYVLTALSGMSVIDASNVLLIILSVFVLIAAELFRVREHSWRHAAGSVMGVIYVAVPFGMMNAFFLMKSGDVAFPWIMLALFILVWVNDVFAYLIGSTMGKHKLSEKLSPKKTWEGAIGGIIFTIFAAWIFSKITIELNLMEWLVLGLIISISANLGDLAESMLKRSAGVKDSGKILPGHGGILDRFDAVLFATPFVFFYLFLI